MFLAAEVADFLIHFGKKLLERFGCLRILWEPRHITYLLLKLKWMDGRVKHMVPPVLERLPDTLTDVKMSVDWFEVPSHRSSDFYSIILYIGCRRP